MHIRAVIAAAGLALAMQGAERATAQIDFGAMPVGCSWTTQYSDGQTTTETYIGRKGGKHRTEVTNGQGLIRATTYDAKGRMVRKDWSDGNWETFSPYSCFSEEGSCMYRYRNSSGADQKIESSTRASGKGFTVQAGPLDEARYPDEYFEVGTLGLTTRNKSETYSARLIELKNCTTGS
jgi:YD repeat-containing protein